MLVVDDEENVLLTISAILRLDGYQVDTARSVAEALAALRAGDPDVVLTDLRLGDDDGQDVLAQVRRERPQTVVVMLTGYASIESAIGALRQGAYDYLIKPSDPEELRATVRRALERRELMRRLVHLQELDELKSQFLSIASHELRTPLTVISGFSQLALRTVRDHEPGAQPDVAKLEGQLTMIKDRADRLGRLVEELLDVTRIQSGRLDFAPVPTDLTDIVRTVVEQQSVAGPPRRYEVDAPGPLIVRADRDHLEQVIANLLDNAAKYSREGGRVRVRVWRDASEANLAVEDEGIGIAPDQLPRIFELFVRVYEPGTWRPGLGVGLYIARAIVERHGGRIWAESEPGRGTRMRVALPVESSLPANVRADDLEKLVDVEGLRH